VNFPQSIIQEARGIISSDGGSDIARAMEEISHASSMRLQAQEELSRAESLRKQAEDALQGIEKEKITLSLRYRRLIDQVEELTKRPQPKARIEEVRASTEARELEEIFRESEPARVLRVQVGSAVTLTGTHAKGHVAEVSHDHAEIIMGDKRLKVSLDQIEAAPEDERQERVKMRVQASSGYVLPINVVGMRVDEALPVIERAVDQALLSGQNTIEIIHGAGTGRLKNAIREYLKGLDVVKGYSDSPMSEGGGNKTVVMFDKG
jgi:DNA mismatch repair protein MutS2